MSSEKSQAVTPEIALSYDDASHAYMAGDRRLASVTEILRATGIYSDHRWAKPEHRLRGQAVHIAARLIDSGEYDETSTHPEIVPYAQKYQDFVADTGFVGVVWELGLANTTMNFAGTLDVLGTMKGELWLLDFKSGAQMPSMIGAQIAAYSELILSGKAINPDLDPGLSERLEPFRTAVKKGVGLRRGGLQLRRDGHFQLRSFDEPRWAACWRAALTIYNLRKEFGML